MLPDKIMSQLKAHFSAYPMVEKVYLFGSRARGDEGERSDIDLALKAPKLSQEDWLRVYYGLEDLDTLLEIDLVNLDQVSVRLQEIVCKEGKIIYERGKN